MYIWIFLYSWILERQHSGSRVKFWPSIGHKQLLLLVGLCKSVHECEQSKCWIHTRPYIWNLSVISLGAIPRSLFCSFNFLGVLLSSRWSKQLQRNEVDIQSMKNCVCRWHNFFWKAFHELPTHFHQNETTFGSNTLSKIVLLSSALESRHNAEGFCLLHAYALSDLAVIASFFVCL